MDGKKSMTNLYESFQLNQSDYQILESNPSSQSYESSFTAKDTKTNKIVDIHQFKEYDSGIAAKNFLRELDFYIKVRPYIGIPIFYGYFLSKTQQSIITEHIPNLNLSQFYTNIQHHNQKYVSMWTDTFKAKLTFGIACTIMHFHSFNAIHRHLNSSIVYFDDNFNPKITDFTDSTIHFNEYYDYGGIKTPFYDSPEFKSGQQITSKSDVYSFGVILLSIVQGNEKFKLNDGSENLFIPEDAPSLIFNIIKHSLNPDPKKRPSSAQIVSALIKNPKLFPDTNVREYNDFVSLYMENVEIAKMDKNLFIKNDKNKKQKKKEKEKNDDDDNKESNYKDELNRLKEENKLLRARIAELESNKKQSSLLEFLEQEKIDEFTIIEKIGSGEKSEVFKVSRPDFFVLKIINVSTPESDQFIQVKRLLNNYETLNLLNHPNIIKTFGFCLGNSTNGPSILLEYCKTNLEAVVGSLNDVQRVCAIFEIAAGMEAVHAAKIIHRDLKPTNILIGVNDHVKVSDFGVSCLYSIEDQTKTMTVNIGSMKFMAPELVNECSRYDNKVDVYAFGVIVFFVLTGGKLPKISITDVGLGIKAKIPKSVNKIAQKLINWCWEKKPEERPSFSQILQFIKNKNFMLIDDVEDEIDQIKSFLSI